MNHYKQRLAHYNDTEIREPVPKDLEFIRSVVKEWPEGAVDVRLDRDGEICFYGTGGPHYNFFPEDIKAAQNAFVQREGLGYMGLTYTREQWLPVAYNYQDEYNDALYMEIYGHPEVNRIRYIERDARFFNRLTLLSWYVPLLVLVAVALGLSVLHGLAAGAILGGLLIVAVNNVEEALGDE